MRRLACHLALAACAVAGSVAHAAPGRHAKAVAAKPRHRAKPAPVAEDADDEVVATDDDAAVDATPPPKPKGRAAGRAVAPRVTVKAKPHAVAARRHAEVVAEVVAEVDDDDDVAPAPVAAHRKSAGRVEAEADDDAADADANADADADADAEVVAVATRHEEAAAHDWTVAIGPYAWASAVDASVSVGGKTVDPSGIHFAKLDHTIKYGGELVGEARYGRFSLAGDVIFGAIGIDAGTVAGPLMVNIHGDVSAVFVDGAAGVRLLGDDHSRLAVEARGGIRYQRTAIRASVGIDGAAVAPPLMVYAGADLLAGGRIFLRPSHRFFFTGAADVGVVGASSSTWSVSADASLRLGSHVQLSLGWRTMAMDRSSVNLVLTGPRFVMQLLF